MTITSWEYPDHTIHPGLPRTWGQVSGITPANAERHGFTRHTEEVPDPPETPKQYSKYRLVGALMERELWGAVKTDITSAGLWDLWEACQELASDDTIFQNILSQMRQTYGNEAVDSILAAAEI